MSIMEEVRTDLIQDITPMVPIIQKFTICIVDGFITLFQTYGWLKCETMVSGRGESSGLHREHQGSRLKGGHSGSHERVLVSGYCSRMLTS